jgi:hypothetical protein
MFGGRTVWLAFNEGSGSNDEAALAELEAAFHTAEVRLGRRIGFPRETVPHSALLSEHAVDVLVIFAGDGTISSIVTKLYGWDGTILVLPGGTMNLLSKRLHGEAKADEIITRVAQGEATIVRPTVLRSAHGDGLTGMLAGPGTAWNHVREAMRERDVVGIVGKTGEAIGESTSGGLVACRTPTVGAEDGYPAITLVPHDGGVELKGFRSESIGDYLKQGLALVRGNFRDGPHETLGQFPELTLASTDGEPLGLLIDGEMIEGTAAEERFALARCEVDLLATATIPD